MHLQHDLKFQRFLPAVLAVALCLDADPALAAVVCSGAVDLPIPATGEGLYLNLVTGVSGTTEAQVPGFDFDPYAAQNSSGQLRFYWGPSSNGGAGVVSGGDTYASLQAGDTIGPDSLFSRAAFSGDTSLWRAGISAGYLGARFTNESSTTVNYGWMRITTTAPLGFPMTVLDWCYEDSGAAITIIPAIEDGIFCDGYDALDCIARPGPR